jgi:hypothetical protein
MRSALEWAAACVGYLAAYLISTVLPTPLLWHLPVERRFTFEVRPLALGADFYGRLLLSVVAGAAAWDVARLALRSRQPTRQQLQVALAWTLSLLCFTAGLYLWTLVARTPIPAPIPEGYVAR